MKWSAFRELSPFERRKQRRSWSHGMLAREMFEQRACEAIDRLPEADWNKHPENQDAWDLSSMYAYSQMPGELEEWFHSHPDGADKDIAPVKLLRLGRLFPATIFGFYDDKQQFIPGILTRMARLRTKEEFYTDPLDEILSEENLAGKTIDEVVAKAAARGMKACNNDLARKRVQNWDRAEPETSGKKPHTP